MEKNEIIDFLQKVDTFAASEIPQSVFQLRIIGKSALIPGGVEDTRGTVDIDSLSVEGSLPPASQKQFVEKLEFEFGRAKQKVHGYYLEFVAPGIVFLPQKPKWHLLETKLTCLDTQYLDLHHVIATKLFSAYANPPRKKDKQDIRAALDQKRADFAQVVQVADQIFDFNSMDDRSEERYPKVYKYLTEELMPDYGTFPMQYKPED